MSLRAQRLRDPKTYSLKLEENGAMAEKSTDHRARCRRKGDEACKYLDHGEANPGQLLGARDNMTLKDSSTFRYNWLQA